MNQIKVQTELFDIAAIQDELRADNPAIGAIVTFIGLMRDMNEGDAVSTMTLEHYPGMTEKQLAMVVADAEEKWSLLDSLVIHRVGDVFPDDVLVLVVIWSVHRGDAFDASRYIMEQLKSKVPFWKKEILADDQPRWVVKNTDGYL